MRKRPEAFSSLTPFACRRFKQSGTSPAFYDEYHLICGRCREDENYYMVVDSYEPQALDEDGWMCGNEHRGPTYCYYWPPSFYEQYFVSPTHQCNGDSLNPKQDNKCYYWKDDTANDQGDWTLSLAEPAFGISCGSYEVCKFDASDGYTDNYYLHCKQCAVGFEMVLRDNNNTDAKKKGCKVRKTRGEISPLEACN